MIDESSEFVAPAWARGAHGQTLAGHLLRRIGGVRGRRERRVTPDGDFIDLDWFDAASAADGGPRAVALLLHGLEGSGRSGYVHSVARELAAVGIDAVALNFRGCSGEPNRLPRAYHAGETGDLAFVVAELRRAAPARPLLAIGFSLGGNVLLRWLGELGAAASTQLVAAAAVSVPFDLAAGADWTAVGPGRLYAGHLIRELKRKVRAKVAAGHPLGARVDVAGALSARTFREFDDAFTAPLHGFRDADDYYARSSSAGWLAGIAVPTLVIHAADDPFLPAAAIPRAALAANPAILARLSAHGGHVGFVAGSPWAPRFSADQALAAFARSKCRPSG